jgi:hypothetical protein
MYLDPSGEFAIAITTLCLIIGAIIGATTGGIIAYNIAETSGAEGWELVGWTALGLVGGSLVCGTIGYGIGAIITSVTGVIGLSITKYSIITIQSVTILGNMPGYITAAGSTGSGFYLISNNLYDNMSVVQRWGNNLQYIKDAYSLGSQFALVPDKIVYEVMTLWREIQYLIENGIPWTLY